MREMLSPTPRHRELGAKLQVLRVEYRLTAEQVAEHLDWSLSKMSRIEKGHPGETTDGMRNCEAVSVLDDAGLAATADYAGTLAWKRPQGLTKFEPELPRPQPLA